MSTPTIKIFDLGRGLFQITTSLVEENVWANDVMSGPCILLSLDVTAVTSSPGYVKTFDQQFVDSSTANLTEIFIMTADAKRIYEMYPGTEYGFLSFYASSQAGSAVGTLDPPVIGMIVEKL